MTQQNYNNQESLRRPEISEVTKGAIKRQKAIDRSRRTVENSLLIMKAASKGHIHETASRWAERSTDWADKSDFLSPIVGPDYAPADADEVYRAAQMEREIELSKNPPNVTELSLYLDGLNTDVDKTVTQGPIASHEHQDSVVLMTDARARLDEIRNREVA